jgi:hypothetical protein
VGGEFVACVFPDVAGASAVAVIVVVVGFGNGGYGANKEGKKARHH